MNYNSKDSSQPDDPLEYSVKQRLAVVNETKKRGDLISWFKIYPIK